MKLIIALSSLVCQEKESPFLRGVLGFNFEIGTHVFCVWREINGLPNKILNVLNLSCSCIETFFLIY